MSRPGVPRRSTLPALLALLLAGLPARGDDDPAVGRGVQYLRARAGASGVGESALMALAMIKADVPPTDSAVAACMARVRSRFSSGGYTPERTGGQETYEAGAVAMVLSNLDAEARRADLEAVARFLIGRQNPNGSWDYIARAAGDTSISQYAVLGLWEAQNGGVEVGPEIWDRAARWFLSTQSSAGSWAYHRDESPQGPDTIAMTAAGTGSLLICRRQLGLARQLHDTTNPLLTPLGADGPNAPYRSGISTATLDKAIRAGLAWLSANFTTSSNSLIGPSAYYALYAIERIGALADRDALGKVDWYDAGRAFMQKTQQPDGSWSSAYGPEVNTVWAILFLSRSTAKTLKRIEVKRLGAGTLLGGRGLPSDLSSLTVAGGRIVSRPMNGAVESMLAVMEDPRTQSADAALAGLVDRYRVEGPAVLRPHKERFGKLLAGRDPGLRRVAAWALGRTGDLDAIPPLIEALNDPDQEVVDTARLGLQLIGRKLESLGPPSPSTPEQRKQAADRWRAWYRAIRPLDAVDDAGDPNDRPPDATEGPARSPQ